MAIASNFDRRLYSVIDGLPALRRIEQTFVSSVVGFRKPSVEFYESVVSGLGCDPSDILVIGDTEENDVTAPRNAGLTAIHLQRDVEHARIEAERQPSGLPCWISSLNELTEVLS